VASNVHQALDARTSSQWQRKTGSQLAAKGRLQSLGHINGDFFNSIGQNR
jgi:hypothetical protein